MRRASFGARAAAALAAGAIAIAACGGDDAATGGAGGDTWSGGGTGEGGGLSTTTSGTGTIGGGSACATSVEEGARIPVTMLILFDKSGSMLDDQKWAEAKAALIAFFQSPESAGLSIALRFFPDDAPVPGCNEVACDVAACATPLVDAGELTADPASQDPQQKALVEAVQSRKPGGETPMFAALAGAEQWAKGRAVEGTAKTAVLLVTDGEPNGCDEDVGHIAALAGDANQSKGVLTYAVGMSGAQQSTVDAIAKAGGTGQAYMIALGQSVHTELLSVFKKAQKSQIACVFPVPEGDGVSGAADPNKVNVSYVPGGGGEAKTIPRAASQADCAGGGWYYDDPVAPGILTLCPSTCAEVQGDAEARIEIVLGCATVVK